MRISMLSSALLLLVSAPGEPQATMDQMPSRVKSALERRIGSALGDVKIEKMSQNRDATGYVACGHAAIKSTQGSRSSRFFVVVPGNFAILESDSKQLLDTYWTRYGCPVSSPN